MPARDWDKVRRENRTRKPLSQREFLSLRKARLAAWRAQHPHMAKHWKAPPALRSNAGLTPLPDRNPGNFRLSPKEIHRIRKFRPGIYEGISPQQARAQVGAAYNPIKSAKVGELNPAPRTVGPSANAAHVPHSEQVGGPLVNEYPGCAHQDSTERHVEPSDRCQAQSLVPPQDWTRHPVAERGVSQDSSQIPAIT